jgi:F0F1-type ATP synthase membrane subunit b/b'
MDLDVTYLFQLGLFLFCVVLVNGLILRPILTTILARKEKIDGAISEAERLVALGDGDREQYLDRIRKARVAAQREREALRSQGRDEERALLASVRAELAKKLSGTREELREAEVRAQGELGSDTRELAKSLAEKILGRQVSA